MDMACSDRQLRKAIAPGPLKSATPFKLSPDSKRRIDTLANKQLRDFPRLKDASIFGEHVSTGYQEGPTLFLEDHRGIELTPDDRIDSHEYRMLALAKNGDFLLVSRSRNSAFEEYLQDILNQGEVTILEVDRGDIRLRKPLAAACLENEKALAALVSAATRAGTFNICPYLSSGYDWLLGAAIACRSGCPVQVCAPLPQLSRRANDKLWFADQVKQILGRDSVPPTFSIYGPAAAVAMLNKLARVHDRLVIKLPASAGSMGNLVLESEYVRSLTKTELRSQLLRRLHMIGWHDRYPILIGVWEIAALASPSAQVWIPQIEDGPPIVEGMFGQILSGENQSFIGASEMELPHSLAERFYEEALAISHYLQCLGYFGRMSLDGLVAGKSLQNARLHWIECNGRWGGVSIPMTAALNLPDIICSRSPLVVQRVFRDCEIIDFGELRKDQSIWTYNAAVGEGTVFLEPTDQKLGNVTFFVVAASPDRAERIATSALNAATRGRAGS